MNEAAQFRDHQAVIGLGSNISPIENLKSALYLLGNFVQIKRTSEVWQTQAVGSKGPDFLNAAVLVSTSLFYDELRFQVLRPIENLLGRVRTNDPNAPRTIDLDILIFDGKLIDRDVWKYAHISVPVSQILPKYKNPLTGESLESLAAQLLRSEKINRASLELNRTSPT